MVAEEIFPLSDEKWLCSKMEGFFHSVALQVVFLISLMLLGQQVSWGLFIVRNKPTGVSDGLCNLVLYCCRGNKFQKIKNKTPPNITNITAETELGQIISCSLAVQMLCCLLLAILHSFADIFNFFAKGYRNLINKMPPFSAYDFHKLQQKIVD